MESRFRLFKYMPNYDFADKFIPKINLFPIHFLTYIFNSVNYIKENSIDKNNLDDEIGRQIELEFEDENITPNQKKKLHKLIILYIKSNSLIFSINIKKLH